MAYSHLSEFIETLKAHNELIVCNTPVSTDLEITEIADRFSKQPAQSNKALLFTNAGSDFPVLINAFGSEKRMALALGISHLEDIRTRIDGLFAQVLSSKKNIWEKLKMLPLLNEMASWMPINSQSKGMCQEVIHTSPDLSMLPVLQCWPHDGGKFITLPMVITHHPETGVRNVGMYRMQVFDATSTGMHWHLHKTGANHYNAYKKLGKKMPISIAIGGDPAHTFSATAPLPENIDEFMLSGFLRKKKVRLVQSITNDIYVPSDADFIIEGYINPNEEKVVEGPFGDHTGFYSLPDMYPKFHVTCITHRKKAVYPTTIVGIPPMEDAWIGKATERIFLAPIKFLLVPEIIDYAMPFMGVAHNLIIVKINKSFPGQALKVMNTLWG
ncbi:MAG: menaquinone biosynthesis decarboxylase, partial [Bacteroidota bacterium]